MIDASMTTTPHGLSTMKSARAASQQMETQFLSQMLKLAGVGRPPDTYGGGDAEAQFQSFICDEQAKMMVAAGGIGLAEVIFQSLAGKQDG